MRARAFVFLLCALPALILAWNAYTDSWFDAWWKIAPVYVGKRVRFRSPTKREVDEYAQAEREHLAHAAAWALASAALLSVFGWECARAYRRRRAAVDQAIAETIPPQGNRTNVNER